VFCVPRLLALSRRQACKGPNRVITDDIHAESFHGFAFGRGNLDGFSGTVACNEGAAAVAVSAGKIAANSLLSNPESLSLLKHRLHNLQLCFNATKKYQQSLHS
jgi:hypothetical protein